ncbi:hypothetical protein FTW19_03575 [Terriglobus albidus]|uniref:Uncharacterized protein n=1 Tax=Terriglobus albidus TaxID=1592106 RepID=A0A5B9E4F3_9BACT|nr:hypothetical protein [Terriglobus albidus]QEE27173.1 hypothetical protein FTW19_03575 [Terriglobus albidus]
MLRMIDENMAENEHLVAVEILDYMEKNQDKLLAEFSKHGVAVIPTSIGELRITPELLQEVEGATV